MIQRLRQSLALLPVLAILAGCSAANHAPIAAVPATTINYHGAIHGGQQPITGATINIYAVGTTGDGSVATSVLAAPLTTDGSGFFDLTNKVTCPSPTSLLYLVATGGNPGLAPPFSGSQISLITALGQCNNPSNIQFINVNEVTTVAAIYALAPFMVDVTHIGSSSGDSSALASAFTLAWQYADITTGQSPGSSLPAGTTVPTAQINTLANLLSACVNSSGGTAGDSSFCGQLFTLLTPTGGAAPADTVTALLNLALNPGLNTSGLYTLTPPTAPFQPTLTAQPADFGVSPTYTGGLTVSPAALNFGPTFVAGTPSQVVTVTNNSTQGILLSTVSLVGANSGDFTVTVAQTATCSSNVITSNGGTCDITVTFTPPVTGSRYAFLVLKSNSPSPYLVVPLRGSGITPTVTLSPTSLTLAPYSVPQPVTLSNSAATPITISSIGFTGIGYSPSIYTQTNNCGTVLGATSSCTIYLTVSPGPWSTSGPVNLSVVDSAATTAQTAALTLDTSGNYFGFQIPASISFGSVPVGTSSPQTFTVTNGGMEFASVTLSLSGVSGSPFTFTGWGNSFTCGIRNPYDTCSVPISFTPAALGPFTDTIYVPNVGTISVSGTGVTAGPTNIVAPGSLNFDPVAVNHTSAP